ncbi:uncharacterized protein LOC132715703 [Ruditapes philippinarum]|uniref:uncharacterized protein LOC132715703 n=1 Tax=Ruditapes philippinarum TaxID=129788 RepID=UPI00295AEB05|nr:uncharacterized protein LOC132715703 [Ruditapes philippinarum]
MQEKCLLKKMNNWSLSIWMLVVFLLTGWVLNIVSFAVPYWNNEKPVHWGLWQMCHEATGCEIISNENLTGMMQTGRVFLTISVVSYVTLIILVVLYLFWKNNLRLLSAAAVTSFLTLVGLFLGAILRISDSNRRFFGVIICVMQALS